MRGKHYDAGKRRVFSSGGYVGVFIAIVIIAVLVAITLLVLVPTTETPKADAPTIVSINYEGLEIGAGSDLNKIYVTVTYSDGTTKDVALGNMVHEGLDISEGGQQNISLNYGGFEDTITVNVKKVDCIRSYSASDGGKIQGDTEQSIISGGDADTVIAVPETGYQFVGWSDGFPYAERKDLAVNETRHCIANFEKTTFSVVFFYRDGTTAKEEKVLYGEKAINVPDHNDPKMRVYGYTFKGWSVDETDYSNVKRDMNIYPRYEKTATDVSVEVNTDKAGNVMGSTDVKECGYYAHSDTERAVIVASPDNSRVFKNWKVLNSDGVYVDLGFDSTEETVVEIGDKRAKVSFRVSSASNPGEYYVSFLCSADMEYVSLKAEFAYSSSSVTFVNYQNKNTGNVECWVDDVAHDMTIGQKIAESGVSYANNKLPIIDDEESSLNRGLVIPDSVAGMTFIGWYMQGDSSQSIISAEQMFIEPSVLVAKWEKKIYNLIFEYLDENGVTQVYSDSINVYYQNTIGSGGGMPAGIPYRDEYVFKGWLDAYTEMSVDDSTQIIMHDEYGYGVDTDFAKGTIRLIALWAPVEHKLKVETQGEGSVILKSMTGNSQDVLGEEIIYENQAYTVSFEANDGYEIQSVYWKHGDREEVPTGSELKAKDFYIGLNEREDNLIRVIFVATKYKVSVNNGNSTVGGYVITEDGATYDSDTVILSINSGNPIKITVKPRDYAYALEKIIISGKADGKEYDNDVKYDFSGSVNGITECDIILERCLSDININVSFKGRLCAVGVHQEPFEQGGTDYPIMQTTLNGRKSDYTLPNAISEYTIGERLFYSITAQNGQYITSVMFDGVKHDLYASTGSVYFYDWEVNGNSIDISLKLINGEYYYCYGSVEIAENGTNYIYCETIDEGLATIFAVLEDDEYVCVDVMTSDGILLKEFIENELDISNRKLSDYSVGKDGRVTSVKLMYIPSRNVNLSATFDEISYSVNLKESNFGVQAISAKKINKNGEVNVSASPITGYKITGYLVNGIMTDYSMMDPASSLVFKISEINEDKNIEILYEAINYNIVFSNITLLNGDVYVEEFDSVSDEKHLLSGTYTYSLEYASSGRFKLTVSEGKCISQILINGEEQPIIFNATEYIYTNYNVTEAVKIQIKCSTIIANDDTSSNYTVAFTTGTYISASVEYLKAGKNEIILVAEKGYNIKKITINGQKDGLSKALVIDFTQTLPDYIAVDGQKNIISLAVDEFEGVANVACVPEPETYQLTTNSKVVSGGTILGAGRIYYGTEASVTVSANANYYISSFKVNGEEIPFVSANWHNKTMQPGTTKYTGGEYKFIASDNIDVEVAFSLFTYKVILDSNSINGTTQFFIDGSEGTGEITSISHGNDLGINMMADAGYHISKIMVNGLAVDYKPYTNVANDNTDHSYILTNVTSDISVYVVYEINRYEFKYSLVNGSANFAGESDAGNRLECSDATALADGVYGNIAHGDNFSIVITPGTSKGYYVYSIRIKYSRYEGSERIRYAGDGFESTGGTIWFNRFLWDNNIAGSVGVTSNIELIEVVFKKKTFDISIEQIGVPEGGTVDFVISNPTNPEGGVYLFNSGEMNATSQYMYLNGQIYEKNSESYQSSNIKLTYIDGEWKFHNITTGLTYDMYFEYSLRYTLTVRPKEGYERSLFEVNEEDRSGSVYNNRYSFNVYKETAIVVEFKILTFEIKFEAIAYQSNNAEVPERNMHLFAGARLVKVNSDGTEDEIAIIEEGKSIFVKVVDYGTKIKLYITPNFEGKGVYLFNLQLGKAQIGLSSDVTDTVIYGGDGIKTVENLTFKAIFKIMEYQIKVNSAYNENIIGETKNIVANDSTGVIAWKSFWNSSAVVKIIEGEGYYVDRIVIDFVEAGTNKQIIINDYSSLEDTVGGVEKGYLIIKNKEDAIYGLRDTLTIYGVKSDYTVTAYFERQQYEIIYEINNLDYIYNLKTVFNAQNSVYPDYEASALTGSGWTLISHHYDELTVTIVPNDGYALLHSDGGAQVGIKKLTVECLVYDESAGEYVIKLDDNGKAMTYEIELSTTGNGDEKLFTFHKPTMPTAERYIESTIKIKIDLAIKEYSVNTTIGRTKATGDVSQTGNDTRVVMSVRDKYNEQIVLDSGVLQSDAEFSAGITPKIMTAQHHGYILYTFTTPQGYMMNRFSVNGYDMEELIAKGIVPLSYFNNNGETYNNPKPLYSVVKNMNSNTKVVTYTYTIPIRINSELIKGSTNPWVRLNDVTVAIDIVPIEYEIKVVINGIVMDYETVNGRNGVTDNKQLTVYSVSSVMHFGASSIEPSLFEGYEITDTVTKIYFGTKNGYTESNENRTGFMHDNVAVREFLMLRFSGENLNNADVSTGKTVIYFIFNTDIIKYQQTINSSVYYSFDNGEDIELKTVNLKGNSSAGSVKVFVSTRDVERQIDLSQLELFNETLEYFTTIRIEAEAKSGFALYGIYEETTVDGKTEYRKIISGERNIIYSVIGGRHTITITVRDLGKEILGNRKFMLDFKQQASISLTIANPYKYIASSRRYLAYADVTAYSSELELGKGEPSISNAISHNNTVSGEVVLETYTYTVYVGNYVKFIIKDRYQSEKPIVKYYDEDLRVSASNVADVADVSALKEEGNGERIIKEAVNYYAYINVEGRITSTKKTIGAITTSSGGQISYNKQSAGTGTTTSIKGEETYPTKKLTINIVPNDNYAFYSIKVRQPIRESSRKQGYLVFQTADALKWKTLTKNQIVEGLDAESFSGSNYFKLLSAVSTINAEGKEIYTLEIWVCGDAEFEVEFYRIYDISYGIYLTDKVAQEGEEEGIICNGISFTEGTVSDMLFGENAISESSTHATLSYGATFTINAEKPQGEYQFVGWYVNGHNLYYYLETLLPTDDYLQQKVTIDKDEMQSLISGGEEAKELTVYAVFQPIVDVMIINEKYYAYEDHFNSWNLGTVLASYYKFTEGKPIASTETTTDIKDTKGKTLAKAMEDLERTNTYLVNGNEWSSLLKGIDATGSYEGDLKENSIIYSSYKEFSLLYQNITNGDFFTNSWEQTHLKLNVTNMSSSAAFSSWQYFNWKTGEWTNIAYQYVDKSLGMSSSGNYTTVDCYFNNYNLNLGALYELENGKVIMPYAISASNENNLVKNTVDVSGIRPLLIRADLYQTITVELSQNLYATDLGNEENPENPEQTAMKESLVRPKIYTDAGNLVETTPNAGRSSTNDTARKGIYEYGTQITIGNNAANPGAEIIEGDIRYRFLGWFMKYNKKRYYMENSEYDASGATTYSMMLTCKSNKEETEFLLIAIYVAQYNQTIYSYNISGASQREFESASQDSPNSYDSAPTVTFDASSAQSISFDSFSLNATKKIGYVNNPVNKYYWINNKSNKKRINKDGIDYVKEGKQFEYYVDAGLTYTISLPDNDETANTVTLSEVIDNKITGYCPATDTPYLFLKNRNEEEPLADYKDYYNSGRATYFDKSLEEVVTANDIHARAFNEVGVIYNEKSDAKKSNQYDLQYVTTATLVFYNLTYQGGISIPKSLANVIGGVDEDGFPKTDVLTVWDESTRYGDYNEVANGKATKLGANGEVAIRVTLIGVINKGYTGLYKFAYGGMTNGQGFSMIGELSGPNGELFAPGSERAVQGNYVFTRWHEVDFSKVCGSTQLFGNSNGTGTINSNQVGIHTPTLSRYTIDNTGSASTGYKIMNVAQFKNIEKFWKNNGYSCVGITVPGSFELYDKDGEETPMWQDATMSLMTDNYKNYYGRTIFALQQAKYDMQGLSNYSSLLNKQINPNGITPNWTPLCYQTGYHSEDERYVWGTNMRPQRSYGFDGILEGNNKIISGIASTGAKTMNEETIDYFGLFAKVSGGIIRNLIVDNAYFNSDDVSSVGIIAGMMEYTEINNIQFRKQTNYAIKSDCAFMYTASKGARVYLTANGADNVGMLAGEIFNSKVSNITISVSNESNYSIEINASKNAGLIAGYVGGLNTEISDITVNGQFNSWIIIGAYSQTDYNGGIFGTIADSANVSNISIDSNTNMLIGNESMAIASGGIVGRIEGEKTSLSSITFNGYNGTNSDVFEYDITNDEIAGKGIYVIAKLGGGFGVSSANGTNGKVGSLVGQNAGLVNGGEVKGVFKLYAGTIGGLVGGNTGRVTGFELQTGYSSSNYVGFTVLAGLQSDGAHNYNIGGIVGSNYNLQTNDQSAEINGEYITTNKILSGIVDDVSVCGVGSSPKSESDSNWKVGHLYVFLKDDILDTNYKTISTSVIENELPYTYAHNVIMGGIVGYNAGSVFNSFVTNTKTTFNIQHNATNKASSAGILANKYSWGLEAGLIVGYHDPKNKATDGWGDAIIDIASAQSSNMNSKLDYYFKKDTISGRIQSCYSKNSVISAVGRVYMDKSDNWSGISDYGNESKPTLISLGGIAGASTANGNSEFSINTCLSQGNVMKYNSTPYGSSAHGTGWHTETEDSGYNYYFTRAIRPFYEVELTMASNVSGIYHLDLTNYSNTSRYCALSYSTGEYTTNYDGVSDSSWQYEEHNSFGHWDADYPDGNTMRYTRYGLTNTAISTGDDKYILKSVYPSSSGEAMEQNISDGSTFKTKLDGSVTIDLTYYPTTMGFISEKVVKTDVKTGLLFYCLAQGKTIRKGEAIGVAESQNQVVYSGYIDGEAWTFYKVNLTNEIETKPSYSNYCVRGQ